MPKTMLALLAMPLRVLLAVLVPVPTAAAGPPEGVSGRMAFDEVEHRLDRYRKETDLAKRAAWLKQVAPSRELRVTVTLGEALSDRSRAVRDEVVDGLLGYHVPSAGKVWKGDLRVIARAWWKDNEADLRRRAKGLPR